MERVPHSARGAPHGVPVTVPISVAKRPGGGGPQKAYRLVRNPRRPHAKEQLKGVDKVNIYWSPQDQLAFEELDPRNKYREERIEKFGQLRRFPALVSPRMLP